jgi:YHS domain-containing protein
MKTSHWVIGTVSVLLLSFTVVLAEEVKLEGVKCLMNPKAAAKADKSVDYKGAKVYFCCDNCPKAFAKDTAKHAAKANMQLVMTKQATQEKCPISGMATKADKTAKVNDVEVAFCCENCQGKVAKASAEEAVELVFSDKAFEKGFKVVKAEEKK